jgi:hypothetical protein
VIVDSPFCLIIVWSHSCRKSKLNLRFLWLDHQLWFCSTFFFLEHQFRNKLSRPKFFAAKNSISLKATDIWASPSWY